MWRPLKFFFFVRSSKPLYGSAGAHMYSVTDRICNLKQNMIFEKRFFLFLGNLAKNVPAHRESTVKHHSFIGENFVNWKFMIQFILPTRH